MGAYGELGDSTWRQMGGHESLVLLKAKLPTAVCFQNLFVLLTSNLNLPLFPLNSLDLCLREASFR